MSEIIVIQNSREVEAVELTKAGVRRRAEHRGQVKRILKRKEDAPLRHLALPDLGSVSDLTLAEFDELCRRVVECKELHALPKSATLAETICRTCYLLFALVESGGLCKTHPEREMENLRINVCGAFGGYIRWAKHEPREVTGADEHIADKNAADDHDTPVSGIAGPRQHLYALGHLHVMAFARFRIERGGAHDGDLLLPPLSHSVGELKRSVGDVLPWLKSFKGKVEWRRLFRHWLNVQLTEIRGRAADVSWASVMRLALWRTLQRERRALLIAARQNLVATSPLPDTKINDLLAHREVRYGKVTRKERHVGESVGTKGRSQTARAERLQLEADQPEVSLLDAGGDEREHAVESDRDADRERTRDFLATLRLEDVKKIEIVKAATALAGSKELKCGMDDDLRYLLRWVSVLLRKRLEISTAYTYASRCLRLMHALEDKPLSSCTTEDIAAYLDNYESPNSVRNVRGTLEDFDLYLVESKGATRDRINWKDKSLLAYEQYRERDCITEDEYRRVREKVAGGTSDERLRLRRLSLLTLLRRCGLRVDEAAWLTTENFLGWTEWRLLVVRSKTRAGRKRMLPLYLLLDDEEREELRRHVAFCQDGARTNNFLFTSESGERMRTHVLGREAEGCLRDGGVPGETAHGLRHAFATGLFAAWWLAMTDHEVSEQEVGWARRALRMYGRPGVESRAISHAYHIQLLLGHADLRVTFDRYVHVLDLVCADAVWMGERRSDSRGNDTMRLIYAARLIGSDDKTLRDAVPEMQRQGASLSLATVRNLLRGRLIGLSTTEHE